MLWLLLFIQNARANEIPSYVVDDTRYASALDKAQQAFYVQSGINDTARSVKKKGEVEAFKFIKDLGIEEEVGATLIVYRCLRDRAISFPVASNMRMTLQTDRVIVTFGW